MDIISAPATKNRCYIKATPMTPVGILVHSTGANNPKLSRYVDAPDEVGTNQYNNTWNNPDIDKCVHAFIGLDINKTVRVAEILPLSYASWGCGKGKNGSYNYNPTGHLQFEICEDGLEDEEYFNTAVMGVATDYCAHLCRLYGLSPDAIVSHAEAYRKGYASDHSDCDYWLKKFGKTMDDFRKAVSDKLDSAGTIATTPARVTSSIPAFSTYNKAQKIGTVFQSDDIELVGTRGEMALIIYPTTATQKCAWIEQKYLEVK